MRTTLDIEDALFRSAKAEAVARGLTFRDLVEDALRRLLSPAKPPAKYRAALPLVKGSHPPAVDPADRSALYDFFDKNP